MMYIGGYYFGLWFAFVVGDKDLKLALWFVIANALTLVPVRIYWGPCPLTMLESALKTGEEQSDSYRWQRLRKHYSFTSVCWWLLIQPIAVWFVLNLITLALLIGFTQ